jgi:transposase
VDITLVELSELLHRKHEASFAPSTVWRFLDRHDLTFKKRARIDRPPVAVETGCAILDPRGAAEKFLVDLTP